ncbi:hypothetical protein BDN71DRAFT_1506584 [Pleurotus eryngii]|uniref:Uncharacterized protein n=1 Tax=Pleurotus eryngii TaxID=5323 RepID=A0A9P5ZWL6_PLEER|nr:hypothetical protein BDN71DRAFT_1506584 [Pleurotus eryngii]
MIGTIAQRSSELGPLGSYDPSYNRPSYNDFLNATWSFELIRPSCAQYVPAFEEAIEALRVLQRLVSETGNNRCLLRDTEVGLGPVVQFERALFAKQPEHESDARLQESLAWPVPYSSAKRFIYASARHCFAPLLAYHANGYAIAPVDLDTQLRGSIVEVSFTLRHHTLRTYDCDQFRAHFDKIVVLHPGPRCTRPLKFNEARGGDTLDRGSPDDVWFATQVPHD